MCYQNQLQVLKNSNSSLQIGLFAKQIDLWDTLVRECLGKECLVGYFCQRTIELAKKLREPNRMEIPDKDSNHCRNNNTISVHEPPVR